MGGPPSPRDFNVSAKVAWACQKRTLDRIGDLCSPSCAFVVYHPLAAEPTGIRKPPWE
jgi:hypothetical protein